MKGRDKMGKVALKIRVMPSGIDVDIESLKEKIKEALPNYAQLTKDEIMPVAFGLRAIILHIVMPDQSPDELIERIKNVENVENVEMEGLSLI